MNVDRDTQAIQSEINYRWWEFYVVRYAIGTVIGALCVYALLERINGNIKTKALMIPSITEHHLDVLTQACRQINSNACVASLQFHQDLYGFNLSQLLLFGIYGLVFCYIASAPGLVVHAVRRQIVVSSQQNISYLKKAAVAITITTFFIVFILNLFIDRNILSYLSIISALLIVFVQIVLLVKERRSGSDSFSFYERLHRSRNKKLISPDSYRHLREHGNAFFIVILELIFLSTSLSVFHLFGTYPYWPALLSVWILPGAGVYFIGHRIEATMIEKSTYY